MIISTCQQHLMVANVKTLSLQRTPRLPAVASLSPALTRIELHNHGSEFVLTVEGSNLSFCNKLSICGEEFYISRHISGKSVEINFKDAIRSLRSLRNGRKVEVVVQTPFTSCVEKNVPFYTKVSFRWLRMLSTCLLYPITSIYLCYSVIPLSYSICHVHYLHLNFLGISGIH